MSSQPIDIRFLCAAFHPSRHFPEFKVENMGAGINMREVLHKVRRAEPQGWPTQH